MGIKIWILLTIGLISLAVIFLSNEEDVYNLDRPTVQPVHTPPTFTASPVNATPTPPYCHASPWFCDSPPATPSSTPSPEEVIDETPIPTEIPTAPPVVPEPSAIPPIDTEPTIPSKDVHSDNAILTFYVCSGAPAGFSDGFCGLMRWGSNVYEGAAACGSFMAAKTHFVIEGDSTGRVYVCEDTGHLAWNQVDIFFWEYSAGRAWRDQLPTYVNVSVVP